MGSGPRTEEALRGSTACLYPLIIWATFSPPSWETRPGESIAADGSARVLLGAGDGWTRGFNPWDPAAQASSCPAVYLPCILRSSTSQWEVPHPSGKSHIPVERSLAFLPAAWEMATSTPGYLYVALTPCFPILLWDIDAHRGSFVQAKRSLSLSLFFICICVEDNHSSEGYSHHKSTMTLFSPSLSLSTVLLYN